MQNPLDESRRAEITELCKAILGTFTIEYTKAYTKALVAKVVEDKKAGEEEPWQLPERPLNTDPVRTGYLTKRGEIKKSWKKRWFVVRHDYVVDYYETEEKWKAGAKPKGTMSLAGFRVETNPNEFATELLRKVFADLKIDDKIPESKDFKELTFEMYHSSRRCWFIQCANQEEFDSWVETFKLVCWRARGFTNDDPVAQSAFRQAVVETRWSLGRWGWWGYGGSEEDILVDLISEHIDYRVLGGVWASLEGPYKMRRMARDQVYNTVSSMVRALVGPAWKSMAASVLQMRPKVEEGVKTNVDPVISAQMDLSGQLKDKASGVVLPAVSEHLAPHLQKLIESLSPALVKAYGLLIKDWHKRIEEYAAVAGANGTGDLNAVGRELKRFAASWWSARDAYMAVREIYKPFNELGKLASNISVWGIVYQVEEKMEKMLDNAMYYFESTLKEKTADGTAKDDGIAAKAAIDVVMADTLARFQTDAKRAVSEQLHAIPKDMMMPTLKEFVAAPCKDLLAPLEAAIPEALNTLISIQDCFDDFLEGLVEDLVAPGVTPVAESIVFN